VEKRNTKCSHAPKNLVIFNNTLWTSETEVQQRTKKSSHFQMTKCGEAKNQVQQRTKKSTHFEKTNCGQAKPKCRNAPKNLVIFK